MKTASLGDLLASGTTKIASVKGGPAASSEMQKAANIAAAEELIGSMADAQTEKLGKDLAYLGYCFGHGLNVAAAEGPSKAADIAGGSAHKPNEQGRQIEDNNALPGGAHGQAAGGNEGSLASPKVQRLVTQLINSGSTVGVVPQGDKHMNPPEAQATGAGPSFKTSAELTTKGAQFRANIASMLGRK